LCTVDRGSADTQPHDNAGGILQHSGIGELEPRAARDTLATTSETWFPDMAEGDTLLDRVFNHRPAYAAALREVESALWEQDVLDPEILELCRLRIAQLLGDQGAAGERNPSAPGLDESLIRSLTQWPSAPEFDDRQRVCLGYAEQLLMDAQAVSDEGAARVIETIGEGGFLVLTYGCGLFETTERAKLILTTGRGL
jgi:alkylhydroperoxidase family enzyme